jgi:hypothetical protein
VADSGEAARDVRVYRVLDLVEAGSKMTAEVYDEVGAVAGVFGLMTALRLRTLPMACQPSIEKTRLCGNLCDL